MRRWCIICLLLFWMPIQMSAAQEDDLLRGMVYFLEDDVALARHFLDRHFRAYPNPQVRQGYMLLLSGNSWEATRRFSSYLEINHRSAKALVGIALATRNTKNSNSLENLERAVRLHPRFYTGHVCRGWHFQQKGNHEQALTNYRNALSGSGVADVKILLAGLYLNMGRPDLAEALIRGEADAHPDNFHFNFKTALAMVNAGHIDQAGGYMTTALEINPGHQELTILRARYLYNRKKLVEARSLLSALKITDFHEEYLKIHARVLIALKDEHRARPMLYQLFHKLPWSPEINLLMRSFQRTFHPKETVRAGHWLQRALISGASPGDLGVTGEDAAGLKPPPAIPFFEIRDMIWLSSDYLLVVGRRTPREGERLHVLSSRDLRVRASLNYRGKYSKFHIPVRGGRWYMSAAEVGGDMTYLYQIENRNPGAGLITLTPRPLPLQEILVGSNAAGSLIYVTDARLDRLALESPFSVTSQLGRKTPLYPQCPFPVFMLNRHTGRWTQLKSEQMLETIPIPGWKRYRLVQKAMRDSPAVEKLIKRGLEFDLSSAEMVKIIVSPDDRHMLVYLADLENAFQAVIYDAIGGGTRRIDQSMFLGKKTFADVDVMGISPKNKRILLVTRDRDREAILFNYQSRLYLRLGMGIKDTLIAPDWGCLYLLREVGSRMQAVETRLDAVFLSPFVRRHMTSRTNLTRLVTVNCAGEVVAETYDGELVRVDAEGQVEYRGVCLEGALFTGSPDASTRAAFINRRLVVIRDSRP